MNRTDVRCVEISSFDGLDEIKTSVYATDKTINTIAKGKNFIIKDGILEVSRSPKTMNISIPAADKVNNTVADKFVVNGFGKFYVNGYFYYIYVINGWIYKYTTTLVKIYDTQLDVNALCDFTVYAGKLIIQNGVEKPIEFDGTTCSVQSLTDPQSVVGTDYNFIGSEISNNSLYYFTDSTIYKPNPATTNEFDNTLGTTDALIPFAPQGGNIIGLKQLAGQLLIVFLANKQTLKLLGNEPYSATASNPHTLKMITDSIGAFSTFSNCDTGTEIYFVSTRGVEKLSTVETYGDIEYVNVFNKIKSLIDPYIRNTANSKYCFMCFLSDKIHILFKTMQGNSVLYSYDIIHQTIEFTEYEETFTYMNVIDDVLTFGCEDGSIYNLGSEYYNHDECYFEFNYYPTKYGLGTLKKWNKILIYVETTTNIKDVKLSVKHFKRDFRADKERETDKEISVPSTWDNFYWDNARWDSLGVQLVRFKNLGKSKAIKFRIDTTARNQFIKIKKIELYYTPMGVTKG